MNFQYLKKVESSQNILDVAFYSAKSSAEETWTNKKKLNKIERLKQTETKRIQGAKRVILRRLDKVVDQFPIIDNLPPIYAGLVKNVLDFDEYKSAINSLKWASSKIDSLGREIEKKVKKAEEQQEITSARKAYYARSASILKKIQKHLSFLEESRKKLKRLPDLKEDFFTVAIAGFPNTGKSSLLKAITSADPEIADYPFTTKGLNVGLLREEKIQLVDVPGTLDRSYANVIEKNAHLVMEHAADLILFLIDPTGMCGYTLDEQLTLFDKTKKRVNKDIYLAFSKADLAENIDELLKNYSGSYKISTHEQWGIDALKELIFEKKKKKTELPSS